MNLKKLFIAGLFSATALLSAEISIKNIIDNNKDYTFIIDPDINIEKHYPSNDISEDWKESLKEISAYEEYLFSIDNEQEKVSIAKKYKSKVEIANLKDSDINGIIELFNSRFKNIEIYKYRNVIYLEGDRLEVKSALKMIKEFNDKVEKDMGKYIIKIYNYHTDKHGIVKMVDKFNNEPIKKIIIKHPKINYPYTVNVDNTEIIVRFHPEYMDVNGVKLIKNDIEHYGYSKNNTFFEFKSMLF